MTKRIKAKVGTYTNSEGKECGDYVDIGVILSNDNGEYALIDPAVNLAGVLIKQRISNPGKGKGDMVMCSIFDSDRQQQPAPQRQAPANNMTDFDSEIPFN